MKKNEKTAELEKLLYGYTYIEFEIEGINEKIANLGEVINSQREIKVQALTGMPGGSGTSDTVYKSVENIIDIYAKEVAYLENKLQKAFDRRNYIDDLMGVLDPIEKKLIELKYFKKYKMWMICSSVHYEKSQVYNMLNKSIQKLLNEVSSI